jgi:thiol-disulfide isomerase/thioredoxin
MARLVLCLFVSLVFIGCGRAELPAEKTVEKRETTVELQVLDWDGLQQLVAKRRGKVVVMDCWSTSCRPCLEEFPKLVAMHNKCSRDDLACVSLSFDNEGLVPIEEVKPPVLAYLERQKATFDNVLSTLDSDALYKKLEIPAVPAVLVYDRQGQLAKKFTGAKVDYAEVEEFAKRLMTQAGTTPAS